MKTITLKAQKRDASQKISTVRQQGLIPAVLYGRKQESTPIQMDYSSFLKTFRKSGESQIIELDIDGESHDVLVHDVQKEPISGDFQHIDFYAVVKGEKVHTNIALEFVGSAPAKKEGAIINEVLKELEVSTLPKYLIESIKVDLSLLKEIGDHIRISDLGIDTEKYELSHDMNDIVVNAAAPAKIEETPVAAEGEEAEGEEGAATNEGEAPTE